MAWILEFLSFFLGILPSSLCYNSVSLFGFWRVYPCPVPLCNPRECCFLNDLHLTLLHEQPTVKLKLISSSCRRGKDLKRRDSGSGHRSSKVDLAKWHSSDLDPGRNVIDDADGLGVWVSGQAVWDDVILHLPRRLRARFLPVDGFACWTLETAILIQRKIYIACHLIALKSQITQVAKTFSHFL